MEYTHTSSTTILPKKDLTPEVEAMYRVDARNLSLKQ